MTGAYTAAPILKNKVSLLRKSRHSVHRIQSSMNKTAFSKILRDIVTHFHLEQSQSALNCRQDNVWTHVASCLSTEMADSAPCQCTAVISNLWSSHTFMHYFNVVCSIWVPFMQWFLSFDEKVISVRKLLSASKRRAVESRGRRVTVAK